MYKMYVIPTFGTFLPQNENRFWNWHELLYTSFGTTFSSHYVFFPKCLAVDRRKWRKTMKLKTLLTHRNLQEDPAFNPVITSYYVLSSKYIFAGHNSEEVGQNKL